MIDPTRHLSVFSPEAFGDKRVDVIGCGATGSRIALSLAKLGVKNLHCWDFDVVEEHNIANQVYGEEAVGSPKVDALHELIMFDTGLEVTAHNERVVDQRLGNIVFMLPDTMSSRKEIWENLKFKPELEFLIETRMGVDSGRVYAFNPNNPLHCEAWEATLCDDDEGEVSACGTSISVGPTAEIISGWAVWQMIKHFAGEEVEGEVVFSVRPAAILTRNF